MNLRPFQRRFIAAVESPRVDTAALSIPRGNGKSWLAAHLLTRALTPGDRLFVRGAEYLLVAASIEQARIVYRFVRDALGDGGAYRYLDSFTRIGTCHRPTNTRLRVLSSDAKRAAGIVRCPLLIADEPGAWNATGGTLMHDMIQTAQGKPGSPMTVVYIGTLAPAEGGWWPALVDAGTRGSTYVQALRGDREKWDQWSEIRRCNPLTTISAPFRRKLIEERNAARRDERLKGRFLSYRLNVPTADQSAVLLTVDDWKRVLNRPVPPPEGRPIIGVDLGGGRSWSAAVAVWPGGRTEAIAIAPGLPSLADQERRDLVPVDTYAALARGGSLMTDPEHRVPRVEVVVGHILHRWPRPVGIVCDRFREYELQDVIQGRIPIAPRVTRWSEASEDIRALRRGCADGPLAVAPESRDLMAASLSVATVKTDDQGSVRLTKRTQNNTSRDDVAAAWLLATGARDRHRPAAGAGYRVCAA